MPLHFWFFSYSYFSARTGSGCFVQVYFCSVNGYTSLELFEGRNEASLSATSESSDLNLFLSWYNLQISSWYPRIATFMLAAFISYLFCPPVASSSAEITCVLELPVCLVCVQPEAYQDSYLWHRAAGFTHLLALPSLGSACLWCQRGCCLAVTKHPWDAAEKTVEWL